MIIISSLHFSVCFDLSVLGISLYIPMSFRAHTGFGSARENHGGMDVDQA